MFEAYITNTALYPMMGIEVGTTVHFPTTTQEVQAALAKIGIDGKRYSEVFITSFDSDVLGLYDYLDEYENIDELNELGHAPVSYTHLDVYKRQLLNPAVTYPRNWAESVSICRRKTKSATKSAIIFKIY